MSRSIGPGGDFQNIPEAVFRLWRSGLRQTHIAHAWGPAQLVAAAGANFPHIIFSPQERIHSTWWKWIRWIIQHRNVHIVTPTQAYKNLFVARGAIDRQCRVIAPAIDPDRLHPHDPDIRARLGFADDEVVLLAPGESFRHAGHVSSLWAAAILNFLDRKYRVLIWGRGPMTNSLKQFTRAIGARSLLVLAEQTIGPVEFEQIVPAADVVLSAAEPPSPVLPLAICTAANLPIVTSESAEAREILQGYAHARIEDSRNPRALAQGAWELQMDVSHRDASAQSGFVVAERFSAPVFTARWSDLYKKAGVTITSQLAASPKSNQNIAGIVAEKSIQIT